MVPFDRSDQAIAGRGHHQGVINDGQIDPAACENSHRVSCRCGFGGHDVALVPLAPAQLLQQPDAQERRRRSDQDAAHATSAVLR